MRIEAVLSKTGKILANVIVVLFSISCIYPMIWMIYSSLKTRKEFSRDIISLPAHPHFDNYINAIKTSNMIKYMGNSLYNAVISVVLVILIGFVIAYFLSRYKFKGRNIIYTYFMFGMLVPIHALLVPIFVQFKALNLYDKPYTLIFPYVAFGLPLSIFLIESYIGTIPREMEEAAFIDGSSIIRTMFTIILPMCAPVISTVAILTFFHNWNEFPFALILINEESLRTIPIGLTYFSDQYSTDYTAKMAAIVLATAPVILVYILFYKNIIKGMTAGAVKG